MLKWFRGWDCKARMAIETRLTKAEYKVARVYQASCRGEKKAFFINSPSHTAIPQAQIEQGEWARERLREGKREKRFDKEGESLISVLHTLLDDQSRKCCFNCKNHISSPVHKLIMENNAPGQRGREEEQEGYRRHTVNSPKELPQNPASPVNLVQFCQALHS